MEGEMMKMTTKLMLAGAGALAITGAMSQLLVAEVRGAQQYEMQVRPLKVALYEGRDCLQDTGEVQHIVLTNDDADWRLQHCAGGVVWKEMRSE
jgi:hypothetical protein